MRVAVKDATILIDLVEGGLLDAWLSLGIETLTTDLVLNEITNERQRLAVHAYVEAGQIRIVVYDGPELLEVFNLKRRGPGSVSIQDCSALHLAVREGAMLLTGDALLRNFADTHHVEVHGTLWILDRLVETGTLPPPVAAEKLATLIECGSRLPSDECEARKRR